MSETHGCCAHLKVTWRTRPVGHGAVTGWWECVDCPTKFCPEALSAQPSGEPPQPRCPKCQSGMILLNYNLWVDDGKRSRHKATCMECEYELTLDSTPADFLQFFGTSILQPQKCPNCDPEDTEYGLVAVAIRELKAGAASHNGQGWVRVEDRLPDEPAILIEDGQGQWSSQVLVLNNTGNRSVDSYFHVHKNKRGFWLSRAENITHWQPLPAPPSEANGPTER